MGGTNQCSLQRLILSPYLMVIPLAYCLCPPLPHHHLLLCLPGEDPASSPEMLVSLITCQC
jgi:hypothetical protein